MLLAIDIGNTHILFGVYQDERLLFTARAKTDADKTEWEYAVVIGEILRLHNISPEQLSGAALSSVVPAVSDVTMLAVRILKDVPVVVVGPGVKTGLNIRIDEPAQTGADLVCTAVGALERYALPVIIIDLGTATKITVVDKSGNFVGGSIAPGVMVSLRALSRSAAQLPHIGIGSRIKVIGTNTVDSMISGSILGAASMIDGMVVRYREILGPDTTVVACGGLVDAIIPHCKTPIIVDKELLMNGLASIYRKNR